MQSQLCTTLMLSGIPAFVRSALLGMGLVVLLMGFLVPHIRVPLVIALLAAGIIIVLGYFAVRRAIGDTRN